METLKTINFVIAVIFFVCYTYQFLYIPVPWLRKARPHSPAKDNRYAVLICARNEQRVIGDLIASLRGQTYSQGLLSIFVLADNCTDDTAMVARVAGANVYERFNQVQVGKGYALQELLEHLEQDYPQGFDGYFVFDADNILAPNYVEAMNRTFSDGHDIVTSYRNSKNYGDNWISAGYALWFLRESRYLNHARFLLGTSCAVSGTGFLFSRRVLEETGPWPFHLLTEDIQFSVDQVTRGRKIAFCPDAVLYDEQPTTFRQSWNQRLRKLTEDLVEASKASTGNIPVSLAPTDLNVLLSQVCGEYQQRLEKQVLEPVLSLGQPSPWAMADGRLLWRVLDNLMSNICKYAMPGTRVYLTTEREGDTARMVVRNISRYPLNISADELTERFVRGDSSRSTEGSGLGLSIATSLMSLQVGDFRLTIDGDLFKVTLILPAAETEKPGEMMLMG